MDVPEPRGAPGVAHAQQLTSLVLQLPGWTLRRGILKGFFALFPHPKQKCEGYRAVECGIGVALQAHPRHQLTVRAPGSMATSSGLRVSRPKGRFWVILSTSYSQWHPLWEHQPCLSLVGCTRSRAWHPLAPSRVPLPVLREQDKNTGVLLLLPLLGVPVPQSAGSTASTCSASTLALGRISLSSFVWTRLVAACPRRLLAESHTFSVVACFWDLRGMVICAHSILQLQYLPVVCLVEPRRFETCTQSMLQLLWYVSGNCAEWRSENI